MWLKGLVDEDFANYKVPSMFLSTCRCDFKCCTEADLDVEVCQNAPLAQAPEIFVPSDVIYRHFNQNDITKAIVVGGMEPFMQFDELEETISFFRERGELAQFVIYTGYYPDEIPVQLERLKRYTNIVVKFGRFVPDQPHRFDEILGVELSSDNQFAEQIS